MQENIILSLDLQGDKLVGQKVIEALSKVGLSGYEKRKISELSGGQKQRVAIARALIKESKYILADEPTGNLDSTTGEEIFQLLKTLASNKLVIVVSHDRDNAVAYGDRVIELKDGIVLSDSGKVLHSEHTDSENYEVAKIAGDDSLTCLDDTKIESISECGEEANIATIQPKPIKRQKTSVKQIVKFATRNMWRHKIRLIAAVLLCAVCLGAFGFSLSFTNYNVYEELAQYVDKYDGIAGFTTRGRGDEPLDEEYPSFSQVTVDEGLRIFGNRFMPTYAADGWSVAVLTEDNIGAWNFIVKSIDPNRESIIPQSYDEVVQVTSYDSSNTSYPSRTDRVLGYRSFDVIAAVDFDLESSRQSMIEYCKLRIASYAEEVGEVLSQEELQEQAESQVTDDMLREGFPNYFVHQDFITELMPYKCGDNKYLFSFSEYIKNNHMGEYMNNRTSSGNYYNLASANHAGAEIVVLPGYDKLSPLNDNQVIISVQQAKFMLSGIWQRFSKDISDEETIVAIKQGVIRDVMLSSRYGTDGMMMKIVGYYTIDEGEKGLAWHDENIGAFDPNASSLNRQTVSPFIVSDNVCSNNQPIAIEYVGLLVDLRNLTVDATMTEYLSSGELMKSTGHLPYVNSIWIMADSIKYNNEFVKPIFEYVTLGAMLLSIIAMLNYIWAVIADSKSKIGGLRAQGMNTLSIVSIYLIEALIVSLMAVVLGLIIAAVIGSMPGMYGVNPNVNRYMDLNGSHFGILQGLAVFGLGVGVGIAGSILPITHYARKTPVELIRAKK